MPLWPGFAKKASKRNNAANIFPTDMEQKRIDRITNVVKNRRRDIIVILEDIHDPHNAAAILRTCDALGIQNVWFIFEKEKAYNPKKVGKATSSSANKWLDFKVFDSTFQCFKTLKQEGYTTIATALTEQSESLLTTRFPENNIAILVGNEHRGLSEQATKLADRSVMIPMMGFVQSLNVSVATAIVLWEIIRQRNNSSVNWELSPEEQQKLAKDFQKRGSK